jgi:hypothetical protein
MTWPITPMPFISEKEKRKLQGLKILIINALRLKETLFSFQFSTTLESYIRIESSRGIHHAH